MYSFFAMENCVAENESCWHRATSRGGASVSLKGRHNIYSHKCKQHPCIYPVLRPVFGVF